MSKIPNNNITEKQKIFLELLELNKEIVDTNRDYGILLRWALAETLLTTYLFLLDDKTKTEEDILNTLISKMQSEAGLYKRFRNILFDDKSISSGKYTILREKVALL